MSLGTGGEGNGGSGNAGGAQSGALGGASGNAGGMGAGAANPGSGVAGGNGDGSGAAAPGTGGQGAGGGASSNLGAGAQSGASWRDALPDDLKADPVLSKYSDVANLAKAHLEAQKLIGKKGIFKPEKDASPEQIKAFREAMGIPTEIDKYDLGKFEGIEVDSAIVDWAKKMGTENGLEPAAMNKMITEYMKLEATNEAFIDQAAKDAAKAALEGLQQEWGEAFQPNIQRANFAAQKLGGQALIDRLKDFGADNDPIILKAFAEASKLYGEDKLREGGMGNGRQTPEQLDIEIKQTLDQLMQTKPGSGAYASLRARHESLWKQKTGGK